MNIIHSIGTLNTGGIQKFLLQLINSSKLNDYKHQVLCTISSEGNYRSEYETNKIDKRKVSNAIAPCLIHSLDGAILQKTVVLASSKGIKSFQFKLETSYINESS